AGEGTDGPAARLGIAPATVGLRTLFDRLAFGDEGDVGRRQRERGGVAVGHRLAEALDRVLDAVGRLVAGLDPRHLHEAVAETIGIHSLSAEEIPERLAVAGH